MTQMKALLVYHQRNLQDVGRGNSLIQNSSTSIYNNILQAIYSDCIIFRQGLTEVSVLSDILHILSTHRQYISLDPVYSSKRSTLPLPYQYNIKKKVGVAIWGWVHEILFPGTWYSSYNT